MIIDRNFPFTQATLHIYTSVDNRIRERERKKRREEGGYSSSAGKNTEMIVQLLYTRPHCGDLSLVPLINPQRLFLSLSLSHPHSAIVEHYYLFLSSLSLLSIFSILSFSDALFENQQQAELMETLARHACRGRFRLMAVATAHLPCHLFGESVDGTTRRLTSILPSTSFLSLSLFIISFSLLSLRIPIYRRARWSRDLGRTSSVLRRRRSAI